MKPRPLPPWCNGRVIIGQWCYVSELPSKPKLDHYYWVLGGNAYKFTKDGLQVLNKVWITHKYTLAFPINK